MDTQMGIKNNKRLLIIKTFCFAVLTISAVVILGWLTKTESLIRINNHLTPMQFNTALCFLVSALGLLTIISKKPKHIKKLTFIIALFSSLSLIEYLFDITLGIDELFVDDYIETHLVIHPGRMAPNTAVSFILISIFLFFSGKTSQRFLEIKRSVACIILGIACVALLGYLLGVPEAYGWSNLSGMALNTSLCFFISALAILFILSNQSNTLHAYTAPLLIFIIFVSAILWQALSAAYETNDYIALSPNAILYAGSICSFILIYFSLLKKSDSNQQSGQYITLVILSFGTLCSITLYSYLSENQNLRMMEKLRNNAEAHVNTIQAQINTLAGMSDNMRVIAYYNDNENAEVFKTIAAMFIDRYPSITRILYAPSVDNRVNFERSINQYYNFDISIYEINNSHKFKAPEQPIYMPVMYEYPENKNDSKIGMNLFVHDDYREILLNSFRKNDISHNIIKEEILDKNPSYQGMVFAPIRKSIYQQNYQIKTLTDIRGFIILEYDFSKMIEKIIEDSLTPRGIHMRIEKKGENHLSIFHKSRLSGEANIHLEKLYQTKGIILPLHIADDKLTVSIWPSNEFIKQYETYTPEIIALILFFTCLIISFYQYVMILREQKIQQIKAYFSAIVNSLPNPVIIQNEDLIFTECNQEFASLFGFNKEDLHSKKFFTQIARLADYSRLRTEDEQCIKTGKGHSSEVTITLENGTKRNFNYLRSVVHINNEKRLIGTLSDLTLEKKIASDLQYALTNAEDIFNSAPDAMVIADQQGAITKINTAAKTLFSYELNEIIGKPIETLVPASISSKHIVARNAFIKENASRLMGTGNPLIAIDKFNNEIQVEISLSRIMAVDGMHVLASVKDISERKAYEKAIEDARMDAEKANQSKSDFLANMSHEIRTPMNAIIGFSHLISDSQLSQQQIQYVNKINTSANALLGIINDILDFSKIEAHKLEIEQVPFDLYADILENITNIISLKSDEKNIELLFDFDTALPSKLVGDPLRVSQILLNLLNNAVKFTDNGEVLLSIKVLKQNQKNVTLKFKVIDSGIGMSPAQIDKLFIPFTQADSSTTRNFGGTGLGLSICHKLVEMMEGKIGVNSIESQGSSFWFDLNFSINQQEEIIKVPPILLDKDLNVLIIDDNPSSLVIMKSYIESFGFYAEIENSAVNALKRLEKSDVHFDLIITDWKMPALDGIGFIKQIQMNKICNAPAIIMMSAFDNETIREHSKEVNLSDILTKPITPSSLFDSITNALGGKRTLKDSHVILNKQIDLTGINILLAEDNLTNQELATELLTRVGAKVYLAENGQKAIELVNNKKVDIVLMDIQMPVLDGISATKILREKYHYDDLPILAMTANALIGDREISLSAGMNDHIDKPINVEELYNKIQEWVNVPKMRNSFKLSHQPPRSNTNLLGSLSVLGLQTSIALNRLNNDEDLYLSLINKFIAREDFNFLIANEKINSQQIEDLKAQIHSVKGLLGNIGATNLVKQCLDIETSFKQTEIPINQINRLNDDLKSLITSIKELFLVDHHIQTQEPIISDHFKLTTQEIDQLIQQLEDFIFNSDTESIDILTKIINADVDPAFKNILASCERYEFDQAAIQFRQLKDKLNKE